ncbi:MAG: class I SAM-dependent methyltransferase, partial [Candidatus Thorarchaeota archaeon]
MKEADPVKDELSISEVYDIIAESFDQKRKYPWQEVVEFINKITPAEKVLDLGCGNGRHMKMVLENNIESVGIDISYRILSIARLNELKDIPKSLFDLLNADTTFLPIKNSAFDRILMIAVFHHLQDTDQRIFALKEIFRLLKNNGKLLISCWLRTHPRFTKSDLVGYVSKGNKEVNVPWKLSDGQELLRYY